jgi:hypothetical protein
MLKHPLGLTRVLPWCKNLSPACWPVVRKTPASWTQGLILLLYNPTFRGPYDDTNKIVTILTDSYSPVLWSHSIFKACCCCCGGGGGGGDGDDNVVIVGHFWTSTILALHCKHEYIVWYIFEQPHSSHDGRNYCLLHERVIHRLWK